MTNPTRPGTVEVETLPPAHAVHDTAELPVEAPRVPFPCHLSFEPLLEWWAREAEEDRHGLGERARTLLREVEAVPELRGTVDPAAVERHRPLVQAMLAAVLPPALSRMSCAAIVPPFSDVHLLATPRYRRVFLDEEGRFRGRMVSGGGGFSSEHLMAVFSCLVVLNEVYQQDIPFRNAQHVEVRDPATGLVTLYQLRVHLEHCRVRPVGPPPDLDPELVARLNRNATDLEAWRRLLPGNRFEVSGLMVFEASEVTTETALSQLKRLLIERDALENPDRFREIETCVQTLLQRPDVRVLVALEQGESVWFLKADGVAEELSREAKARCLPARDLREVLQQGVHWEGCTAGLCQAEPGRPPSGLQAALLERGLCQAVLAPLLDGDEVVGYLAVASDRPEALSSLATLSLREVFPLFALAVRNRAEMVRERIQAVIKENFTAIHPAVEWRFQEAAMDVLRGQGELPPLVFSQVYPLYGISDIRSSSEIRLQSIQVDLEEQLARARAFLAACLRAEPLPYLAHLVHTVDRARQELERQGLCSGQETTLLEFLRREVEKLFDAFPQEEPAREARHYREALDPDLGMVYRRRRDFEESVSRLRERVGEILAEEQVRAQAVFPHYFEMHKTDGVDHMIYAGASLTQKPGFGEVHLKSLRIWQLETMVRIARETEQMRRDLPLPLGTAHLVLVQETPLAIRFMMDDRRFDVDGAYNARYEIVKKRLDKAELRSTGERLTQPGLVAIVYSHPREAAEYREYLRDLADSGELDGEVEDHELKELQGVQGLRALRIKVRVDPS